eukprot:14771023-Ditylum_brightwellii.AAC.2
MAISVECKSGPSCPQVLHIPKHVPAVDLVECIFCINQKNTPVFFFLVLSQKASIPTLSPDQSCMMLQASVTSSPHTEMMHFPILLSRISPTSTGQMPGHLSKAMRQPATNARYVAHAGCVFASHL